MRSPEETVAFGRETAAVLRSGMVLALTGELGAGKTHFVKGLAAGLGYNEEVTSPTFMLLHEYSGGRLPLFHFDFYRLQSADEALGIDFDDYLGSSGVLAIEWADKFPAIIPADARWFRFQINADDSREVRERA